MWTVESVNGWKCERLKVWTVESVNGWNCSGWNCSGWNGIGRNFLTPKTRPHSLTRMPPTYQVISQQNYMRIKCEYQQFWSHFKPLQETQHNQLPLLCLLEEENSKCLLSILCSCNFFFPIKFIIISITIATKTGGVWKFLIRSTHPPLSLSTTFFLQFSTSK